MTLDGLGKEFRIDRSGMKPYACCRGLHACLDALFQIMQETGADASAIRRMIVHGNAQFCLQFDRPEPANLLDAQFSMQYALAVGGDQRARHARPVPAAARRPSRKSGA